MKTQRADVSMKVVPLQAELAIEPLGNWVLIRKYTAEEKVSPDGVIIPAGQGRSQRGVVLAAGLAPAGFAQIHPGDMVIYTNFPLEVEDLEDLTGSKDLQLVRYEELYARVKNLSVQAT